MIYFLVFILLIIGLMLYRTFKFTPYQVGYQEVIKENIDYKKSYQNLSELIKCKTISYIDYSDADKAEFTKFQNKLKEFYPLIFDAAEFKIIRNTGLYFKIDGKSSDEATVLMAHYDVVSVGDYDKWEKPPFSGIIEDGILFGRGTIDTKGTFHGVMESLNHLLKKGYKPKHDLYLCFGGDEECEGNEQKAIKDYLVSKNVNITLVVDEGGAIVSNAFPTVKQKIAAVGTGEKGSSFFEVEVKGDGGHSSNPPKHTALGKLASHIVKIENMKYKTEISKPFSQMLDIVGRHTSFGFRFILANRWLFNYLLIKIFLKSGGEMAAMCHTTSAVTMAEGAQMPNILPNKAKAVINYRSLNIDSNNSIIERIKQTINDPETSVRYISGSEASVYSDITTSGYNIVKKAINQTWGTDVVVTPYLMVARSDSRHYSDICDTVCRFCPMELDKEHRNMIHNYNEQMDLKMIDKCIEFYINLLKLI
jgi:carboxypeptidase PM20D1